MINRLVEEFSNWYKPNELKQEDMDAIKLAFILNNFTMAYSRSHNLEDYEYNKANKFYSSYFSTKKIMLNLLSMLIYVWNNAGGDNQKIKEEIRDNVLEPPKTRIMAVKNLANSNYQKIAMYIYQTALKENVFKLDESRKNQLNKYLDKGEFDVKSFRGYNTIFTNSEKTCIKNFLLGNKIKNPVNKGVEDVFFFERPEVISEIMHLLNIMVSCYNSKNIEVLNTIKNDVAVVGTDKLAAIKLLEDIKKDAYVIDTYKPKTTVGKTYEIVFNENHEEIDWGEDDDEEDDY